VRVRRARRGGATLRTGTLTLAAAALLAGTATAREVVVVSGGVAIPLGDSADFTDTGGAIEVRFRHLNTGHSAWELGVGYFAAPLSGVIPETVESYEALVRTKNLAAQQQSGPGQGFVVAEYGTLEVFDITAQYLYRFSQRGRFSPFASVGAGVYHWRVPFRLRFYQVPSFGEQHAYDPMGASGYQFVFDDDLDPQVINFSKDETSGGLNAAVGIDLRATRAFGIEAEARAHLLFTSGEGVQEDPADNQPYLDNMSFLRLQGTLYYRF
jgi:hypothetical protein